MSNKFNKSRSTLPRPKVCNPPLRHGVPPLARRCLAKPLNDVIQTGGFGRIDFLTFALTLPEDIPVGMELSFPFSVIDFFQDPFNKDAFTGFVEFTGPFIPVLEHVRAVFTFEDDSICILQPSIDWIEM